VISRRPDTRQPRDPDCNLRGKLLASVRRDAPMGFDTTDSITAISLVGKVLRQR
jgi:hypothetical protein